MNPSTGQRGRSPADDDDLLDRLDRLVDGELGEEERRALLLRLDQQPEGWRQCALAFLEAQSWREALAPLRSSAPAPAQAVHKREVITPRPTRRQMVRLTGVAAGLALAFALGWTWRGEPEGTLPQASLVQHPMPVEVREPVPAMPADPAGRTREPSRAPAPSGALDALVKRWEQRGYQAETQKRLIAMELKDGRKLAVPIQEVRLRYVGGQIY